MTLLKVNIDLYPQGIRFESWLRHQLFWEVCCDFPQSLYDSPWNGTLHWSSLLPSTFFQFIY